MIVTSKKSISFPKLGWAISAGEEKELPEDKASQERILQETEITPVDGTKTKVDKNIKNNKSVEDTEEK